MDGVSSFPRAELDRSAATETIWLYEMLLGESWSNVASAVQRAHPRELPIERIGSFDITHGCGFLAWILGRFSKLPAAGRAVPTRLRVERVGNCEIWHRTFGTFPLESTQHVPCAGVLVEHFGSLIFRFKVQVRDGGIHFQQTRVSIRVGRCELPLPSWLGPRVDAQEMPEETENQTRVRVTVRLPIVGLLIDYQGRIEQPEIVARGEVSK